MSEDTDRLAVDFGDDDLVPAVAQDADSGEVLMLAYVSPEALRRTVETGRAHYHSRSRDELWEKGATSGHTQAIEEIRVDCDADALLYLVDQTGGACHTGYRSCFYRTVENVADGETVEDVDAGDDIASDGLELRVSETGERAFDPDDVYE